MYKQVSASTLLLSATMWLTGCALPQGAISVNSEISASIRTQQVEVEKAMEWALRSYYDRLSAAKTVVLARAIQIEKVSEWRVNQTALVWEEMKNGNISGTDGTLRMEGIRTQTPNEGQLELVSLSAEMLVDISMAVDARYEIAKEALDAEKHKVISQLRDNTNSIIAANDKITRALEVSRQNALQTAQLTRTILSVVAPYLPGIEKLSQLVEQFEESGALTEGG